MSARPPFLRGLPLNVDRLICDCKEASFMLQRETARLLRERDPALADALAAQADGLRRELLRVAQALRAQGGPNRAA